MRKIAHTRLQKVWSKLQIPKLMDGEFEVVCVMDTDTMAVQSLDEIFQYPAPAAMFRGQSTQNLGAKRPLWSYGTRREGQKQVGGINGGVVLYRPTRRLYQAMMDKLERYVVPSMGAEQDFLTDFFRDLSPEGITPLPRSYNWQLHIAMLTWHFQPETSWCSQIATNWKTQVRNWHFSADPKPVDMGWGSVQVNTHEPATPPWRETSSSSSAFIERAEHASGAAAAPWRHRGYVDMLLTEMRCKSQIRGVNVPDIVVDPVRDMCQYAYHSWVGSLYNNVWPNVVYAVHKIVGEYMYMGRFNGSM